MAQVPFPAPGDDGDEPPLPGDGGRDGQPGAAGPVRDESAPGDDDFDPAADLARMLEDIDAGLIPIPPEDERAPAVTFSVGETDVDPAELAAMAGPGGLGGQGFGQHDPADAMRPGPLLSVLTEQAAGDPAGLSDDELLGMVSAARRLACRAQYLELTGIAEFSRRRAGQYAAAVAAGKRPGRRDGEFAGDELAMELVMNRHAAGDRMELAGSLAARLPRTRAGLAAGLIDADRAAVIWSYTRFLSDADAACADAVLAAAAPGLRHEQLAGRAYRLEIKLDPAGVARRREEARRKGRRVETRREQSGNMAFGGRELSAAEALAARAVNDADALALRHGGMAGTLQELRVLALLDRARGLNPLDRLTNPGDGQGQGDTGPGGGDGPGGGADYDGGADGADYDGGENGPDDEDEDYDGEDGDGGGDDGPGGPSGPGGPAGGRGGAGVPAPFPALINLLVPAGTMFGWSNAAGEAGSWGLLDPADTRSMVAAASEHRRTRWCITVTGPDGTAVAHGCARGRHPWTPPGRDGPDPNRDGTGPPGQPEPPGQPGPDEYQRARLAGLLRELNITLTPIARGTCDHSQREDRYTPSRALKHLVQARTARCVAPGCGTHAADCDIDHTLAYPAGPTCPCDLSPACRHHHHVKQAPGWRLDQPEPGLMRWTAPSGRVYTTTPTVYDT